MERLAKNICFLVLAILLASPACIREKREACPPKDNLILNFKLANFSSKVHKLEVAIYDSAGRFVEYIQLGKERLNKQNWLTLGLCPGRYSVAYWANAYDNTSIKGISAGDDTARVVTFNPAMITGDRIVTQDSLYYAYSEIEARFEQQTLDVNLKRAFQPIRINIDRLMLNDGSAMNKNPVIKILNVPAGFDFKLRGLASTIDYQPPVSVIDEVRVRTTTDLRVNLFNENNPVKIQIWSGGANSVLMTEFDLWDFIRENNIDLDNLQPGYLPVYIAFVEAHIIITPKPWEEGQAIPDLSPGNK